MRLLVLVAGLSLVSANSTQADIRSRFHHSDGQEISFKSFSAFEVDDARFEIDEDEIIMSHLEKPYEEIRITPDYRMFVDDVEVQLTPEQKETVKEFYEVSFEIRSEAKAIAREGVKIGLKGAKIGMKAVGSVLKMIFTSYTEEDLDRELDLEGEKLDEIADRLEERAEALETRAERWQELGWEMKEGIAALQGMDWL